MLHRRGCTTEDLLGRRGARGLDGHVARRAADRSRAHGFTRTMSSIQLLEFIAALKVKSESLHVVNMFTSPMRKVAPAIVLSQPARDVGAAGARLRQAGRVPVRQHPSARARSRRGAADGRARSRRSASARHLLDNQIVDHRADLQRRRHRHVRHAGRSARQRDAAHPRACARTRRASTSIATPSSCRPSRRTACIACSTTGIRCCSSTAT